MFDPLYIDGGGLDGFRCRFASCKNKVTRTESGMLMHTLRVHGEKLQLGMFDEKAAEPIRDVRREAGTDRGA